MTDTSGLADPTLFEPTTVRPTKGAGAMIVCSVHIGDGAMIGVDAVVTKSAPAYSGPGVPARVLLMLNASNGGSDAE